MKIKGYMAVANIQEYLNGKTVFLFRAGEINNGFEIEIDLETNIIVAASGRIMVRKKP